MNLRMQSTAFLCLSALAACEQKAGSVSAGGTNDGGQVGSADVEDLRGDPALRMSRQAILDLYSDSSCDALSGVTGQISSYYNRGLRGAITVPSAGRTPSNYLSLDVFEGTGGRELSTKLYFSDVNVPTRAFDKGFPRLGGGLIKDDQDHTLVEYFRIDLDGFIELGSAMPEGDYELAILADDGAQLELGRERTVYASNPSHTETKLMCGGGQTVRLRHNETLPLNLSYFQGPRYHIALMLLWRQATGEAEPLCGQKGNNLWFDSTKTPSKPQAAFRALESRGWSVVPATAFRLPDDEILNPCQSEHVRDIFDDCTAETCGGVGI